MSVRLRAVIIDRWTTGCVTWRREPKTVPAQQTRLRGGVRHGRWRHAAHWSAVPQALDRGPETGRLLPGVDVELRRPRNLSQFRCETGPVEPPALAVLVVQAHTVIHRRHRLQPQSAKAATQKLV